MNINGKHYRTIWPNQAGNGVWIIDQTTLPHRFELVELRDVGDVVRAIATMQVRGATLIGGAGAYGLALALQDDPSNDGLAEAYRRLLTTRPTAVNLRWALDLVRSAVLALPPAERGERAFCLAGKICDDDVATSQAIAEHGWQLLRACWMDKGMPDRLNVLTHCNAGWLATIDWGTALAPIYLAHDHGMPIHVWVDETRPRNQGASLTAFELGCHGVAHTVIADNVGGHLMQQGMVDLCIVGTDRTTAAGDVCNKIGTYLKALAAWDNAVPFYVALPHSSIDWTMQDGVGRIAIERRDPAELSQITGRTADGRIETVNILPEHSAAANWAFDVTPARYITALITERGVCPASRAGLAALYGAAPASTFVVGSERHALRTQQ
ncbi:MAG TPA: S-methyl-5-thioribose-1-phosphate isomerase [Rhodopseudomonas sp.]|uniref:S-methyl-5-thioribose-1-phosphate isomerase n=1 Tax=Rhodopseudomonas sp. TaxID=1078 RepID=UPI002ED7E2B1